MGRAKGSKNGERIVTECLTCHNKIETSSRSRKYCSKECFYKFLHNSQDVKDKIGNAQRGRRTNRYHKNYEEVKCLTCGTVKEFPQSLKRKFCSLKCWHEYEKTLGGSEHFNRKNGKWLDHGYYRVSDGHNGWDYEHRLVMEAHIGRKLTSKEHVHHIDNDKKNNKISNLMLFPTNSAHQKYHGRYKKYL
jgi:endogenous inhibitor of DNA gyrase (YacG/DUF329 family)